MPERMIREGIISSDAVNTLSWGAEVFYRRLMNKVDDFARYDGRTVILRAHLYPLQLEKVSEADVAKWIAETQEAGLVSLYHVDGKPFLHMEKFRQRIRAKASKWPPPPVACQATAGACQACASESEGEDEGEYEDESGNSPAVPSGELPTVEEVVSYGRGAPGIDTDYCRHYHAKKTETHGWIKNGRLIVWRSEICRWWAGDRELWFVKKRNGKPKNTGPNI